MMTADLEIVPTEADKAFAHEIYHRFAAKEGADYIASEVALAYLAACLRLFAPRTVLELGAGIGTITEALLMHPVGVERLVSTESNAFCLEALRDNLSYGDDPRLTVVTSLEELLAHAFKADMIVGDGGFYEPEEARFAKRDTVFFAEGYRGRLRRLFADNLDEGLGITFKSYRESFKWKILKVPRFGLHIPFPFRIKIYGCFIGIVEETSAEEEAASST